MRGRLTFRTRRGLPGTLAAKLSLRQLQEIAQSLELPFILVGDDLQSNRDRPSSDVGQCDLVVPEFLLHGVLRKHGESESGAYQALDGVGSPDVHEDPDGDAG